MGGSFDVVGSVGRWMSWSEWVVVRLNGGGDVD
jgi:hypothetical protein